jgi:hypothetical protein
LFALLVKIERLDSLERYIPYITLEGTKCMTQPAKQRGGDVKKAPVGFYTAKEAQEKLGLNRNTFQYYVRAGKIKKVVPPLKSEGFYAKREIDRLAAEIALFLHTTEKDASSSETRVATPADAPGIVKVLAVMGWQTASVEQRLSWYKVNPFIDYVVLYEGEIMGYITAVPYKGAAMRDMMSGKKRAWDITPDDIQPYRAGKTYDLYVGIATRQDIPNNTRFGFRLIGGFMNFLVDLAEQNITIHRLYAVSAEPDGQKLCRNLGFVDQEAQADDLFPRFVLDLETSDSHFARIYREGIQEALNDKK